MVGLRTFKYNESKDGKFIFRRQWGLGGGTNIWIKGRRDMDIND